MTDPINDAKDNTKPSDAPTPGQAVNNVARLLIVAVGALIAFIVAAAAYIVSHFRQ